MTNNFGNLTMIRNFNTIVPTIKRVEKLSVVSTVNQT